MSEELSTVQLFVRPLPFDIQQSDVEDLFAKSGPLKSVRIMSGYAFVEYEQAEDASSAVATFDNTEQFGGPLEVHYAKHREFKPSTRGLYRALVKNLPENAAWQELKDFVKDFTGIVPTFCKVDYDHIGHLEFGSAEDLAAAIEKANGAELDGAIIEVEEDTSEYVPPPPRSFRGGRGGGFGGFGGRGGGGFGFRGGRGGFRDRGDFGGRGGGFGGRGRGGGFRGRGGRDFGDRGDRGGRGGFDRDFGGRGGRGGFRDRDSGYERSGFRDRDRSPGRY
ncbi:hypothetical protein PACTADRAFT_48915 [Pachysolen tannophilus NRRL Y-2460]|uniref:RRM domain-containing protein n=1 Tax=Pachysolen tannophilus NRRL Y-2460 TaxID=669874 RepID=A0A1E4TZK4_PACTA|nr:hypothetical protein PACTADRAFT_48915 [Pachysolen tannophilus NRRL Y-2460]